jgi:hypothetical protein
MDGFDGGNQRSGVRRGNVRQGGTFLASAVNKNSERLLRRLQKKIKWGGGVDDKTTP